MGLSSIVFHLAGFLPLAFTLDIFNLHICRNAYVEHCIFCPHFLQGGRHARIETLFTWKITNIKSQPVWMASKRILSIVSLRTISPALYPWVPSRLFSSAQTVFGEGGGSRKFRYKLAFKDYFYSP
jgi:hypothetical protein